MPWTIHNSAINGMVYYWGFIYHIIRYIISFIIYIQMGHGFRCKLWNIRMVNSQCSMRFPLFISYPHEVSTLLPKYYPDYIPNISQRGWLLGQTLREAPAKNISQSYWSLSRWTSLDLPTFPFARFAPCATSPRENQGARPASQHVLWCSWGRTVGRTDLSKRPIDWMGSSG